ncbi:adenylate and guanylate cyclase catalytic domain containing protein [Nitzschia inconspicua]|uniref:Adenylate and guanylate cyclase catalytic domain containing protein n=1 Tax=Nitzschia inconspicua TaxID=303405 RepID=A0A9K3K9S6_9STRA|nr:adenylate/guanylate cyclase [Nitzschia inconspicua]KAG7365660.1 adenylate and guanylate cyclase catalytic domain containing protein [Nitzschia inconspicua]
MSTSDSTKSENGASKDDNNLDASISDHESRGSGSSNTMTGSGNSNSISKESGYATTAYTPNTDGDRTVRRARLFFLLVLLLAAAALGGIVYWITDSGETDDFITKFESSADAVIKASNENVLQSFNALETLSVTLTSFVKEQMDNGYPSSFITVPDTEFHLGKASQNANAFGIAFMPHVAKEDYFLWEEFSAANQDWIAEANLALGRDDPRFHDNTTFLTPFIFDTVPFDANGNEMDLSYALATCRNVNGTTLSEQNSLVFEKRRVAVDPDDYDMDYYTPAWQWTPAPNPNVTDFELGNFNLLFDPLFNQNFYILEQTRKTTFYDVCDGSKVFNPATLPPGLYSLTSTPIFEDFQDVAPIVGTITALITWKGFFENILVEKSEPVYAVVTNRCAGKTSTFLIEGAEATFMGNFDAHDSRYDGLERSAGFADFAYSEEFLNAIDGHACTYTLLVYPTKQMEDMYSSNDPWIYAAVVIAIFIFTAIAFFLFDCLVQRRQKLLSTTAARHNAIVSSLFPKKIHMKLIQEQEEAEMQQKATAGKAGIRKYLLNENVPAAGAQAAEDRSKPIADLFPDTTIMFADIVGFTAWSSAREPSQVFTLLESIYRAFDMQAKKRRVFKVEVVGDCYVAVCGLPDPKKEHFVIMARFSVDCLRIFHNQLAELEVSLGPDTCNLALRVGLHSGPVVAGVLRGEKSRFQLFGDTMNTASRMESTGVPNKIQISQETATLLSSVGKEHWYTEREDKITAKGKGELNTYFLHRESGISNAEVAKQVVEPDNNAVADNRLLKKKGSRDSEWCIALLTSILVEMANVRAAKQIKQDSQTLLKSLENDSCNNQCILEEVVEYITLPEYSVTGSVKEAVDLDTTTAEELQCYVETIASLYNANPFHNFRHATQVAMNVNKLLNRIIAPDLESPTAEALHDHSYGITSDPLTKFAVVFSALIHDCDHPGVPNMQLVKENTLQAKAYKNKSIAEQNSLDIAWMLLMEPQYANLRSAIYCTKEEFIRFRKLVVNTVMATDIVDADLKKLRNDRWDAVFQKSPASIKNSLDTSIRATIVIEHLIQASDVAHAMQHWLIYRRWNENFFEECYLAHISGRAETDPSLGWYKGELGFFDFYIIPLAKKLKECGVFGACSDEYLAYAVQNRTEWERRGQEIVMEMTKKVKGKNLHRNMKGDNDDQV